MFISQYNTNTYPTFGSKLSGLSAKKLQKLVEQGYSDYKIAEMYGVSNSSIRQRRKKFGISARTSKIDFDSYDYYYLRTLIDEGNSLSQIATFYQKSVSSIRTVLKHFNLKTQEALISSTVKKEELSKLIDDGKTIEEIADELLLEDYRTVTHLIKKFNLDMPIHKVDKIIGIDKIADLIFRGMKPEEIAIKYKTDVSSIINKMKASGFDEVYKELYQPHDIPKEEIIDLIKKEYSISEIAEIYHVSLSQMIQYMVKNKVLNTDIPTEELVKSIKQGLSMSDIAMKHEVFKGRVPRILAENDLKTRGQTIQISIPKEIVEEKIQGCKTYVELAQRLHVSPKTAKGLTLKYGLEIAREILILPEVQEIEKIITTNPKISIDEIAQKLGVEPIAVERVVNKNKIKIYTPHKIRNYNSFEFARWISWHLEHGDSPVQLGELMGVSSEKARKIVEKLSLEYENSSYIEIPKIPKDKISPTRENIINGIINSSKEYFYPKKNPYNYSQIHMAKDFIKVQICKKYKISDTTFEYLLNKYDLNDIFEDYAKTIANR